MDELKEKDAAESDYVDCGDCEKTRTVDSTASDAQISIAIRGMSKELASDRIVDSAATEVQDSSVAMEFSKEIVSDRLAGGDWEETRNVDSAASDLVETPIVDSVVSDVQVGSRTLETSKETDGDCVANRDCEKTQVDSEERLGDIGVEKSCRSLESEEEKSVDVGVRDDQKMAVDSIMEVSSGEDNHVVAKDVAAAAGEEELEGKSRNEYADIGGINGTVDLNSSEIRLLESNGGAENSVTEVSSTEKSELVENGEDSLQKSETEDPEIDAKVVHLSTAIEDPNAKTPFVKEETVVVGNNEKDSDSGEKDPIDTMILKSFAGHTHVSVHGTVASMENEDITNIEGMDSHAFNENFCFSVEELQAMVEPTNGSTENHLVVAGDDVATENKTLLDSEKDRKSSTKECQSQSMSCDSCHLEESLDKKLEQDSVSNSDELVDSHEEQNTEEQDTDSEETNTTEEKTAKRAVLRKVTSKGNAATYQLPPDDEGEFEVSDLVWGKVRSHPWWPGQIFDPSDASEKAMKYQKKDCFLVAYFGDRTFAWNDASLLKPFRSHFSKVEKQNNSETFHNAVDCALEEVSRRVEFGLACSCISEDIYNKINHQIVENAGICEESCIQNGTEKSLSADLFEPGKLVDYMKALAQSPASGADRLQIVVAKSQLMAYYRLKGYSEIPEFQFCGGLLENDDSSQIKDEVMADNKSAICMDDVGISSGQQTQRRSYHKRKHNLKDNLNPKKKEKNKTELIDSWDSVDDEFGFDGKAQSKVLSQSSGKKIISVAKSSPVSVAKPSFKIGECIRRVASQMTGSPSILKSNNTQKIDENDERLIADGSDVSVQNPEDAEMKKPTVPTEYSSLDELLLQLQLAAQDPLKGYSFLTVIVSFFSDFRNETIMEQRKKVVGKKRQQSAGDSPDETFEFDDMNDTYWTDRVIQNGSEEKPPRKARKRDNQKKALSKSNSRKRNSEENYSLESEKAAEGYVDDNSPAELVMHFPVVDSVPSESKLIKMFKRFGPLKEIETEIDRDTNRARVVFRKSCDAQTAYSSATKFNIFGSTLVNYQVNYAITMPFKTEPFVRLQADDEDSTVFLQF